MALTEHYYTKFKAGCYYHIYNRSVDRKPMFKSDGNYEYFLKRYDYYLDGYADTYAYCLMNNHFHFLIRISDEDELAAINKKKLTVHDLISNRFKQLFQSYALAFNKQQERIGTLFQTPFKRVLVDNENYFSRLVYYIHANPQLHGFIDDFREYTWSSYGRVLMPKPTKLHKQEVLNWFGGTEKYIRSHSRFRVQPNPKLFIEDE